MITSTHATTFRFTYSILYAKGTLLINIESDNSKILGLNELIDNFSRLCIHGNDWILLIKVSQIEEADDIENDS